MRSSKPAKLNETLVRNTIALFLRGDAGAFELIYGSYRGLVYHICWRILRNPVEAEDAAQDVFVRLFCKLHTFRGESAFSTWLYKLTTNVALMRFRRKERLCTTLPEYGQDQVSSFNEVMAPNPPLAGLLAGIALRSAVDLLPTGYKAVFVLHELYGYDHREVASILGHSVGNSKSQLHKARKRLRELLNRLPKKRSRNETQPIYIN